MARHRPVLDIRVEGVEDEEVAMAVIALLLDDQPISGAGAPIFCGGCGGVLRLTEEEYACEDCEETAIPTEAIWGLVEPHCLRIVGQGGQGAVARVRARLQAGLGWRERRAILGVVVDGGVVKDGKGRIRLRWHWRTRMAGVTTLHERAK
jgi:hypothetical protein